MTNKEVALEIIKRNEKIIRDKLLEEGYLFDDEFEENYIPSPVARTLSSCIEDYFKLENEQYVIREEINAIERSNGVFYFSECEMSLVEVREMAKRHYNM
ncbi:MAG: hypothetical protein ACI4GD_08540 [Lachnospiraceae bacterium]